MPTQTLRPSGDALVSANHTFVGGASAHAVTADNSDTTYVRIGPTQALVEYGAILDFDNYTIPAGSVVKWVMPRVRCSVPQDAGQQYAAWWLGDGTKPFASESAGLTTIMTWSGSARTTDASGAAWSQTKINSVQVGYTSLYAVTAGFPMWEVRFYEFYVDVVTATQPTVTVNAPTGTITTTTRPTVSWTYTQGADGGPQTYFVVKVFTAAQVGGGGFNPATTTPIYNSGSQFGSANSWVPTADLPNGSLYAYVDVAQTINGAAHWSAWASHAFTLNNNPPAAPSLSASANNANARVTLTLSSYSVPGGSVETTGVIEFSDDGGTTWTVLRGTPADLTTSPNTFYDYDCKPGVARVYRAKIILIDGISITSSAYSSTTGSVTPAPTSWWLKCPGMPALNTAVRVRVDDEKVKRVIPSGVFTPLGSANPLVIQDTSSGATGTYTLRADSLAEDATIRTLLASSQLLLLQSTSSDGSRFWYLRVLDYDDARVIALGSDAHRWVTFNWVEVDSGLTAV